MARESVLTKLVLSCRRYSELKSDTMQKDTIKTIAPIELHYGSTSPSDEHVVSARLVTESLKGLKKALEVIHMSSDDIGGKRKRTSIELYIQAVTPGSVCLEVGWKNTSADTFSQQASIQHSERFWDVLNAIAKGNKRKVNALIPDKDLQNMLFAATKKIFNSFSHEKPLILTDGLNSSKISTAAISQSYDQVWNKRRMDLAIFPVLIGRVSAISFKNRNVTFTIPQTMRTVSINYLEEHEDILVQSARELVEIHCDVTIDEFGAIRKVEDLREFVPVDLKDMKIEDLLPSFLEVKGKFDSSVKIELCDDQSVYYGTYEPLEIYAGGHSRASIESEIRSELSVLWKDIVKESDENLSVLARLMKQKLFSMFREKSDAVAT